MYAYKTGSVESKKCKGIKKCVVRKTISFEDYKNCVYLVWIPPIDPN